MKKSVLTILLGLFITSMAFGQIDDGSKTKSYTIKELEVMNKLELANLYVDHMNRLVELLPFVAFNQYDVMTEGDLGIPKTPFNLGALSKLDSATTGHSATMSAELPNIVPFSDKYRIINGILFIQRSIEVIENGMK